MTEQIVCDPWRSHDPRDVDWHCDHCDGSNYDGPPMCMSCNRQRVLNNEEEQQLLNSQKTGETSCKKILLAEALIENIGSNLDSADQSLRHWTGLRTQRLKVGNLTKYILLALNDEDMANPGVGMLLSHCKSNTREFNFPGKSLDEITLQVLYQEFGITEKSEMED